MFAEGIVNKLGGSKGSTGVGNGDADKSKGSSHKHRTMVPSMPDSLNLDAVSGSQWT